jgi:hypothetical protein
MNSYTQSQKDCSVHGSGLGHGGMPRAALRLCSEVLSPAEQPFYDWVYTQSQKDCSVCWPSARPRRDSYYTQLLYFGELRPAKQDFYD